MANIWHIYARNGGIWRWVHHGGVRGHPHMLWKCLLLFCTACLEGERHSLPPIKCIHGIMVWAVSFVPLQLHLVSNRLQVMHTHWLALAALHTWCEVLLACRWHIWPGHNVPERLGHAFDSFHTWCLSTKKRSSISKFELKTFKMSSYLEQIYAWTCMDGGWIEWSTYCVLSCHPSHVRLQAWPGGCGKAFDCTLMSQWLLYVVTLENFQPNHETKLHACYFFNVLLVVVGMVKISSDSLVELRKLLLMPLNFFAGHWSLWMVISRDWAKGVYGCQGNKQSDVHACANNSLKLGGMHAYCCSAPLGPVFTSVMCAVFMFIPTHAMHAHACPCMSMHAHACLWYMHAHACPCMPMHAHAYPHVIIMHVTWVNHALGWLANLWTWGRCQCLECVRGVQ